ALLSAHRLAGLLPAFSVVLVGGDFMHARLLRPSLVGLLLPVMSVPAPRRGRGAAASWAAATLVLAWCVPCALAFRPRPFFAGIADERAFYVQRSGLSNPITLEDYARVDFVGEGTVLRA